MYYLGHSKIENITKEDFKPFGEVISTENIEGHKINNGTTTSYNDLINVDIDASLIRLLLGKDNFKSRVNIFKAKKRIFPLEIDMLEYHEFGSQAFIPLQKTIFIVIVAPFLILPISSKAAFTKEGVRKPNLNQLKAFMIPPEIGVNLKPQIWHYPLIATEDSNFLVIDKKISKWNLDIYKFNKNNFKITKEKKYNE